MLTSARLKELLSYDPETGLFTWITRPCNRVEVGSVAGYLNQKGYVVIGVGGTEHQAHRLAVLYMGSALSGSQVDHINHNRADNRFCNLRLCTSSQNKANCLVPSNNTSDYKGVWWRKDRRKWEANITKEGTRYRLGLHTCKHEAAKAYNLKALELFGKFACLNDVKET